MKKVSFTMIAILLTSSYLLAFGGLPARAQDGANINVTKRRPDRPMGYSPTPVSSEIDTTVQPEVKQVQTTKSAFLSDLWVNVKAFFVGIFQLPSASTTTATP